MRGTLPILLAVACLIFTIGGCGSGGSGSTPSGSGSPATAAVAAGTEAVHRRQAAEAKAPKGASPTLRAIYATFPAPTPNPEAGGSAAATIRAGEKACRGKTPIQVKEEFYAAVEPRLSPQQAKLVGRINAYESHSSKDASFTAGQLAADVYEATLPEANGQFGYQGCVYALARTLERKLAPNG